MDIDERTYRVGQVIAMLDAHNLPAGTELEWVVVGATARIVSLPYGDE